MKKGEEIQGSVSVKPNKSNKVSFDKKPGEFQISVMPSKRNKVNMKPYKANDKFK